ncbi:hypothetical protein R1flu_022068 [Riccia fluitans]|uniref:RNA helicase n=1 Tax=Riccia fluitans TaxID=41844 RepID=A0ABD1ZR47_9MARC
MLKLPSVTSQLMFRTIRLQSHRRLLGRADLQRLNKKSVSNGTFTRTADAFSEVADSAAKRGISATCSSKLWDRSSTLSIFHRFFSSSCDRVLQSKLLHPGISRDKRFLESRLLYPRMELGVSSRELSWYAVQQYSDDEFEEDNAEEFSVESWRRRLRRLMAGDQQELISKDKKDRREFCHLGPLLKSLGLHGQMYAKTIVISKHPLPNYRPDLDDRRPQRVVVIRPQVKENVDSFLQKHIMQKKEYPSSVFLSYSNNDSDDEETENSETENDENSGTERNIARVEHMLKDERKKRRSIRMKNRQRSWQELPEGQKMLSFRKTLPAYKEKDNLLEALCKHQVIVVSGETGCGKTTQLPQFILESEIAAGRGADCRIICTQPRRISAISVAERVASERGEEVGETVGYQVRMDGQRGRDTRLLFCTSGILLRRLMNDSELKEVSHVLVDEIHERGMNEDFLLIVLKNLLSRRPDLKLVLMSATLNAEMFSSYFDGAPMLHIPGFTYPVRSFFLEDVLQETGHYLTPMNQIDDYGQDKQWKMQRQMRGRSRKNQVNAIADAALAEQDYSELPYRVRDSLQVWNPESLNFNLIEKLLAHICKQDKEGAVLVFMTGVEDISALLDKLRQHPVLGDSEKVMLLPCHGSMGTPEQKLIFNPAPPGVRKIVLATNMAETSITINDVVFVVDCGKAKESSYDALNNTPCLLPQWISQASARQRRGRAGRVKPGVAYHLYPRAVYDALDPYQLPELLRTPLHAICLTIKSLGLESIEEFLGKALQPPEERAVHNAVELLKTIGALDDREVLTDLGRHLSKLPVEPKLGKMLLMGSMFGCLEPVLTIAAGFSVRDPFLAPADKKEMADEAKLKFAGDDCSDHLALVCAFEGWMKAQKQGRGGDYCWQNFLSMQTLQSMLQMRRQFFGNLLEAGFDVSRSGDYSKDVDLLRGVICAGLFPGVASAVQKSRSLTIKTKDDGQVNLHQSSVNGREQRIPYPWLVFNEKVKTSSVNIRDSTGISDSILLLFGGEVRKGCEPGHLLMQDGYLEFFMDPDLATMILMVRDEMDELIQRKLEDPKLDFHEEGKYLVEAVLELLHGDQCEGQFVFGRKASGKKDKTSQETQEDVKGFLQQLVQRGGKPAPRYKTKGMSRGGFQSTVMVKGKAFLGKPASSKKQAEKNASKVALEWLLHSQSTRGPSPDRASSQRSPLIEVNRQLDGPEAALTQFIKSKESRRRRKVKVSA